MTGTVASRDAAERVVHGLLSAAEALELCAARCEEWQAGDIGESRRDVLRRRGEAYAQAARVYRQVAACYHDIGRRLS